MAIVSKHPFNRTPPRICRPKRTQEHKQTFLCSLLLPVGGRSLFLWPGAGQSSSSRNMCCMSQRTRTQPSCLRAPSRRPSSHSKEQAPEEPGGSGTQKRSFPTLKSSLHCLFPPCKLATQKHVCLHYSNTRPANLHAQLQEQTSLLPKHPGPTSWWIFRLPTHPSLNKLLHITLHWHKLDILDTSCACVQTHTLHTPNSPTL